MSFQRYVSTGLTAFSIAAVDYKGDLQDCTLTVENETEEGKAVVDTWAIPIIVGSKWSLEGTLFLNTSLTSLMATALAQTLGDETSAAISITLPEGIFTGYGVITKLDHKVSRGAMQTYSISILGQGALGT